MFSTDPYTEEFDRIKQNEMFGTEEPIDLKNEEGLQLCQKSKSNIGPCKINEDDEVINILGFSKQELQELLSEIRLRSKIPFPHNIGLPRLYEATQGYHGFNRILMQLMDCEEIKKVLLFHDKIKLIPISKKEYLIQINEFWAVLPLFLQWLKDNTKLKVLKI